MFSAPLKGANKQIEHTRHQYMDLKEMLEGAIVVYGIESFVDKSVEAYNELAQAQAQVRASIASTKGVAGETFEEAEESAEKFQKKSLYTVDSIERLQSQLLTFKAIGHGIFDEATQGALDLSTKMQGDTKASAVLLGNALQDPIKGIGRLHRVGIDFTETQKEQIKNFVQTNQLGKAQAIILGEIKSEFGGSAEAAAKAGTGGWTVMKNSMLATQESIGELIVDVSSGLMPILAKLNTYVADGVHWLKEHEKGVKFVLVVMGSLITVIGAMIVATKAWVGIQAILDAELWANPIGVVILAITALVAVVYEAWENFGQFRGAILGAWAVMKQVGENIKNKFTQIPKMIIQSFMEIPKNFVKAFKGVGAIISALVSGNFKAIPGLMKDLGGDILKTNPIFAAQAKLANEFTAGTGDAFTKVYDQEVEAQRKTDELREKEKLKTKGTGEGKGEAADADASKIGAGLSEIKTGAPKTFNINIQKMNGIEHFETTNYEEAPSVAGESLLKQMFTVLNNAQVME